MKQFVLLAALLLVASPGFSHPGGLNGEGCHNNRKTGDYHCHRGKASADPSAGAQSARSMASPPQQSSGPTCYTGPRGGTYTITKSGRKNYSGC
jgi:hypothetical protein